jgi:hypothetical protein
LRVTRLAVGGRIAPGQRKCREAIVSKPVDPESWTGPQGQPGKSVFLWLGAGGAIVFVWLVGRLMPPQLEDILNKAFPPVFGAYVLVWLTSFLRRRLGKAK